MCAMYELIQLWVREMDSNLVSCFINQIKKIAKGTKLQCSCFHEHTGHTYEYIKNKII